MKIDKIKFNDIDVLFDLLKKCENFAISRFNDGECLGMLSTGIRVARGDQIIGERLQNLLIESFAFEKKNYFKGVICPICFNQIYLGVEKYINPEYSHYTKATVFTNKNITRTVKELSSLLKGRKVIWIGADKHKTEKLQEVGIKINEVYWVPSYDGFHVYDYMLEQVQRFEKGSVVFLSCGPTARPLVMEYWKERDDVTYIDIGSVFDPWAQEIFHNCHNPLFPDKKQPVKKCKYCN